MHVSICVLHYNGLAWQAIAVGNKLHLREKFMGMPSSHSLQLVFSPHKLLPPLTHPYTHTCVHILTHTHPRTHTHAGVNLVKPASIYQNLISPGGGGGGEGRGGGGGVPKPPEKSHPISIPSSVSSNSPRLTPLSSPRRSYDTIEVDFASLSQVESLERRTKELEKKLEVWRSGEIALDKLQDLSKIDAAMTKFTRDITSSRADTKRVEGRMLKVSEDISSIKSEMDRLGKSHTQFESACIL